MREIEKRLKDTGVDYKPTPQEKRLLEALSDEKNRNLSDVDLCSVAKVSVPTLWRARKREGFQRMIKALIMENYIFAAPQIARTQIFQAREGESRQQEYIMDRVLGKEADTQVNILNQMKVEFE